jgi:hypothetical protein
LYKQFYFEELPFRVIFKIGLTADSLQEVASSTEGYEKTFYTNLDRTSGGTNKNYTSYSTVSFYPKVGSSSQTDDTYYKDQTSNQSMNYVSKAQNASSTYAYSFAEIPYITSTSGKVSSLEVTQYLGNNGSVTISKPKGLALVLKKEWGTGATQTDSVTVDIFAHGTRTNAADGTTETGIWEIGRQTITAANNWTAFFSQEATKIDSTYTYQFDAFYAKEDQSGLTDILATYKTGKGSDLVEATAVEDFDVGEGDTTRSEFYGAVPVESGRLIVLNTPAYTLPSSGGVGAGVPVAVGCVLSLCSLAALTLLRRHSHAKLGQ